jgi:predicted nucleic acid-binding protein
LVDSDWIISAINGQPAALAFLGSLVDEGVAISAAALAEVLDGAYGTPDPEAHVASVRLFLDGYRILDITEAVADVFAQNRALLRDRGNLIPDMDLLIAATAIVHDLTLVTRNERHFARVPGLRLYRPEPEGEATG